MTSWNRGWGLLIGCLVGLVACTPKAPTGEREQSGPGSQEPAQAATIQVESSAFRHEGEIPKKYTCEGDDLSPPLFWSGLPKGTQSLALIVDDPDAPDPKAPKTTWVHWVLYNLPPTTGSLPESVKELPSGAKDGTNDWKRTGYGGPCPPIGRHRYFHKIYALDAVLPDLGTPTKAELEKAMKGHVIGKGELIGTYEKSGAQQ